MNWLWVILALVIVLPVIGYLWSSAQVASIQKEFAELGTLAGRTKGEIIAKVGAPSSISAVGDNQTLLQWQTTTQAGAYHVALLFTGDVCEGVTSETAV